MDTFPRAKYTSLVVTLLICFMPYFFGMELSRNMQLLWGASIGLLCFRLGMKAQWRVDSIHIQVLGYANEELLRRSNEKDSETNEQEDEESLLTGE